MRRTLSSIAACTLVVLVACSPTESVTFTPASYIDSLRILGIRAEPPEIAPGETTRLSALVVDPEGGRTLSYAWVICDPDRTGMLGTPCGQQQNALELGELLLEGAEGIRIVPFLQEVDYTAPEDTLDLHEPGSVTRRRGLEALVLLVVFEGTDPAALRDGEADFRVALKRIRVVDTQPEPNRNPQIESILLGDRELPGDPPAEVDRKTRYTLRANATDDSAQTFPRIMPDGSEQETEENLFLSWHTTAGAFDTLSRRGSRSEPGASIDLEVPADAELPGGQIDLYVVLRDARGGIDWARRTLLPASR